VVEITHHVSRITLSVEGLALGIAFVFPGQGSQVVGMGRDLYEQVPAAREVFDRADRIVGFRLSELCFAGPQEQLTATEHAQPALLTTSVALLVALGALCPGFPQDSRAARGGPRFVAGHSLGEFSALVAAGSLDFATALRLVSRRGALMAAAREGTMAAVIALDERMLEQICAEVSADGAPVVIANYNSPGQLVISGATAAVERAGTLAKERGARRVLSVPVSAAFHSPLMREAASELTAPLSDAEITDARVPVISNVTAEPLTDAVAIRAEQITAPVRWIASIQHMAVAGVDTFIEIGPGKVLTGLIRRIVPGARLVNLCDLAAIYAFLERDLEIGD
jgi:[acyl-carrier-protein] S-malonyltransferase